VSDERLRRWDTDERGHGVASASSHLSAINELAELAGLPDWVTEDPEAHLLPGLRRGAEATGLTITSFASDPEGTFTVHLKGAGDRSKRELRQAAWTIIGFVAELSSHVRESRDEGGATYEVVTGNPQGAGPFATHGHSIRLVIDSAT
jgi:hypothetical protein